MLLALEGVDASGKQTQASLLVHRLRRMGLKSSILSFPRYAHTHCGACIGEYLDGALGDPAQLPPKLISMLYAGDRFESLPEIESLAAENDVVVFDRYVASNLVYQSAKVESGKRAELLEWIDHMEHEVFGLPRPDINIFLDVPIATTASLMLDKRSRTYTNKQMDIHEENLEYLTQCRSIYLDMIRASPRGAWISISCVDDKNQMLHREQIAASIWEALAGRLSILTGAGPSVGSQV